MRSVSVFLLSMAALAGCDRNERPADRTAEGVPADNTKVNGRDRGSQTVTPMDQAENEIDRAITQKIRQGVMKEDALSFDAKNVKIITADGVVTLRGPVKTEKERVEIASLALRTDGVKRVENQLEVAAN